MATAIMDASSAFNHWVTTHLAGMQWAEVPGRVEYLPWADLPLSSATAPLVGMLSYWAGIIIVSAIMKRVKEPIVFPRILFWHNVFLTVLSVVMAVGIAWTAAETYFEFGFDGIWNDSNWVLPRQRICFWLYIFYISKYYELLDTLFILLKKKQPEAVQVWHHSVVMVMFWGFLNARMMNHWMLSFANSAVHTLVYGYFAASTLGIKVPWKRYITVLQISQFVADMVFALPFPIYKSQGITNGDWELWWFGNAVGLSFIVLFTRIYFRIKRASEKQGKAGAGAAAGAAPASGSAKKPKNE